VIISGGRGLKEPANFKCSRTWRVRLAGKPRSARRARSSMLDGARTPIRSADGQDREPSLTSPSHLGAIQHLAGMRTSKVIVAITKTKTRRSSRLRLRRGGRSVRDCPKLTEEIRKLHG